MALSQKKIGLERVFAQSLSDEKLCEFISSLTEDITMGEEYLSALQLKGKSSYKKLDELSEEVYELRQKRTVLIREQNLRHRERLGLPPLEDDD